MRRRAPGVPLFRPSLAALAMIAAGCVAASALAAAEPVTLVAERTLRPDGTLEPGLAVVVGADGTILRVVAAAGDDPLPEPVRRFAPGSVLSPGLHELLSSLGAPGEHEESAHAFDPAADAALAIDPLRRDLDRARGAGILVATIGPAPRNPVSGRCATFLTGARPSLEILGAGAAPLAIAVGESALDPLRQPTSRSGLRLVLAAWLEGPGVRELAGSAPPFVHCGEAMDVRAALELFAGRAAPTLVLAADGLGAAELLAAADAAHRPAVVVVGPYGPDAAPAELAGAAALARAGVEIALRGAMPAAGDDALRDAARRAVGHGLDPAAARRAITANPARAVGLEGAVGAIEPGARADLVVFSGDPLLAGSRVVAVFQGGAEVPLPAPPDGSPEIPEIPRVPEIPARREIPDPTATPSPERPGPR